MQDSTDTIPSTKLASKCASLDSEIALGVLREFLNAVRWCVLVLSLRLCCDEVRSIGTSSLIEHGVLATRCALGELVARCGSI